MVLLNSGKKEILAKNLKNLLTLKILSTISFFTFITKTFTWVTCHTDSFDFTRDNSGNSWITDCFGGTRGSNGTLWTTDFFGTNKCF